MSNITVTIPDESYRRARTWAAQRNTSVSAVMKYLLDTLPAIHHSDKALPVNNLDQSIHPESPE
jgi:hypothetical protein